MCWMRSVLYSTFIIYFHSSIISGNASVLPNTILIEEAPIKLPLIEEIVKRVSNISLSVLSKKRPEIKAKLIIQIHEKLNKSAQALGEHGSDYVKCIMRGVMAKAFEPPPKPKRVSNGTATNTSKALSIGTANKTSLRKSDDITELKTNKEELMRKIAEKMQKLTNRYLSRAKTPEERATAIEYIKEKIKEFAERDAIPGDIDKYEDLISKGFDLMLKKHDHRRMESTLTDVTKNSWELETHNLDKTEPKSLNTKLKQMCHGTLEEVCEKIDLANTLKCHSDSNNFNILKLCDGEKDCLDASDENQCTKQALKIVQNANQLVTFVDLSMYHDCYPELVDKAMTFKQNRVIDSVLKTQLTKLEKHSIENSPEYSRKPEPNTDTNTTKEMIQETATVVDSLISALGMLICPNFTKNRGTNRAVDIVLNDDYSQDDYETNENKFPIEVCKCKGKNCLKQCSERCSKICQEMYSLSQLSCEAVSGENFVSFDSMCDGKFDCYDETDEKDCSMDTSISKFEATNMYNYILKSIEAKVLTVKYELIRSRFQSLHALVTKFQMLSLRKKSDISELKTVRQEMFDNLMKVYDGAARLLKEIDLLKMHFYLVTLKERLVSAVKRSNTGNEKIVSANSCLCRGYKCALTKCSKSCDRACSVEPKLTRFFCSESSDHLNNSLPIELLCNGKPNCPNGEDEKGCRKELCRPHHLTILRRKLQNFGRALPGSFLGETLKSWRVKVTATLANAEGNERPTPPVLHEILRDMLHDLVMSYASMGGRENAADVQEYYKLSRVVIDTLKFCNV